MDWQPIESAPKDGTDIFVFAIGYTWPEVIRWELFSTRDAEEVGVPGYWRYSEDLLSDACVIEFDTFTHWSTIVLPVIA
ncbi:hypothetical protein [Rhizobium rhizogenes]|uniref:hypothetical protein n=1 Tax=Rhizobium rhizogenes TaxID=359 RepID=UPI0004D629C1|nr:hypothetical protein [Rhizobium rhizogenes]KEA07464.1 hypothetical protein CN09_11160 [Rhizobium rhizogenes]NTJ22267.1 hypothetical protein [Rhizobium rhizogenes]QUE80985.1 hypothetical protein EML492_04015 [Rhizobium rhizogenes]TQO80911.1 hypothetical protein FFE80_07385 [Rhizobium rhizogenes]TRB51505.1 hypothetical protein EXN69_26270 [Rhizobium rhizogenes]